MPMHPLEEIGGSITTALWMAERIIAGQDESGSKTLYENLQKNLVLAESRLNPEDRDTREVRKAVTSALENIQPYEELLAPAHIAVRKRAQWLLDTQGQPLKNSANILRALLAGQERYKKDLIAEGLRASQSKSIDSPLDSASRPTMTRREIFNEIKDITGGKDSTISMKIKRAIEKGILKEIAPDEFPRMEAREFIQKKSKIRGYWTG